MTTPSELRDLAGRTRPFKGSENTAALSGKILTPNETEEVLLGNSAAQNTLVFLMFVLIFFQKFIILNISVTLYGLAAAIAFLITKNSVRISMPRIFMYTVMMTAAVGSQICVSDMSISSLSLFGFLTIIYAIDIKMTYHNHLYTLKKFSTFMLIPAILVFVQYMYQKQIGVGHSLSLDSFIPNRFLLQGYMAESSTSYWITWNRPNGMVFLEPSFCSGFLACAIMIELQYFRNHIKIMIFLLALSATNGGTGWLLIVVSLPIFAVARYPLLTIAGSIVLLIGFISTQQLSADLPLLSRLNEFNDSGSSGYGRLILPFTTTISLIFDERFLFAGNGAGQITVEYGSTWPITKLIFEYGIITAAIYLILFCAAMFKNDNVPLRVGIFVVFQFTGGYLLSPFMTILTFVLCTAFRLSAKPAFTFSNGQHRYIARKQIVESL